MDKLTSRKLWMSVAAMLAGIGATVAGASTGTDALAVVGAVCTALSAGIYAFAEAWVDGKSAQGTGSAAIMAQAYSTDEGEEDGDGEDE